MTPRKSQQGASANARRGTLSGVAGGAPSPRTRTKSQTPSRRGAASDSRAFGPVPEFKPARAAAPAAKPVRAAKPAKAAKPARASKPVSAPKPKQSPARDAGARPAKLPRAKGDPTVAWRWWLLPLVVIAVAAVFVGTYYPVAKVQYRETREKMRLEAELKAIQARNQRLQASVDRLKTPDGVEDYARAQLGLVKQGEHVVVVVDGTTPAETATSLAQAPPRLDSDEAVVPPDGPWTSFLDEVFGVK